MLVPPFAAKTKCGQEYSSETPVAGRNFTSSSIVSNGLLLRQTEQEKWVTHVRKLQAATNPVPWPNWQAPRLARLLHLHMWPQEFPY